MVEKISGDTEDLPNGWTVDSDNWGTRPQKSSDEQRLKNSPPEVFMRACFEDGMLCVHTAAAAKYMDGISS